METGYLVCDVMTRKPITVSPDATLAQCAKVMKDKGIASLVVKENDTLKGYLAADMIVENVVAEGKDASKLTAQDVMTSTVHTIGPAEDILSAFRKMRDLDIRQLPVVDPENQKLVGLLTMKHLIIVQAQILETLSEKLDLQESREGERQDESARAAEAHYAGKNL